jgi:hypothetical protein
MGRTIAPFRFTRVDPGETIRQNGIVVAYGNNAPPGAHFDQLLFEAHGYEHVLGPAAQLAAKRCTITWDQAQQRFEDKDGLEVVLADYDRVAVIGMDTLTDNIVIDNVTGLEMFHIGNTPSQSGSDPKFKLGDAGSGEPYKILLGPDAVDCKLDLMTDKPFRELSVALTDVQKQYIANQGKGNHIKVNGVEIYNPSVAGEIITLDTPPVNPYLLRLNGGTWAWSANAAVNGLAWFRDLNIALDGIRSDGTTWNESNSRFTTAAIIGASAYLFQLNKANRFMSDMSALDSRVHDRTDPNGISHAATAAFVNTSNVVTFSAIGNIKNNMRINGALAQGIPDGSTGTTILRDIDTTAKTAKMYNALTGAAVPATSTVGSIAVTIDNSGAAGGSHDEDAFQGHRHEPLSPTTSFLSGDNVITTGTQAAVVQYNTAATTGDPVTDTVNGPPRTHDQTQPISQGIYYYYRT